MIEIPKLKSFIGEIKIPGDKSISHRALLFSALAKGKSKFRNLSTSHDVTSTKLCIESMGIQAMQCNDMIEVSSSGRNNFKIPNNILDAGNSGSTIRMLSGILAAQKFTTTITGDESLCKRPMKRIVEPLKLMGAEISTQNGFAPINFTSVERLNGINYEMPVSSAQVKSAILLAGIFAEGETVVKEKILTRDHTERMLNLSTKYENKFFITSINKNIEINPFENEFIPSDPSTAAFIIAMALLSENSSVTIPSVCINKTRIKFIEILNSVSANIFFENERDLMRDKAADIVVKSKVMSGDINLNEDVIPFLVDEIPILAALSIFKKGKFKVTGAKELRVKESDRIKAVCTNLNKLGIEVCEYEDGFEFESKENYKPTNFEAFGDHRIAMAFTIAGMKIGNCKIDDIEICNISFPGFKEIIKLFTKG